MALVTKQSITKETNSTISPKNKLNDLTGKEWIQETCSVFYQKGLGSSHKETKYEIDSSVNCFKMY